MSVWSELIEALFPIQCVACGRKGAHLCALCERTVITHPVMLSDWQVALFEYRQPIVKKAIHELKYGHRAGVAEYFGNALYREFFSPLAHRHDEHPEIVLVPIPGGSEGNNRRGYNHSGEIAHAIARAAAAAGLDFRAEDNVLCKHHEVKPQAKVSGRGARERNVEGLFFINDAEKIRGKHVVIVDDVITTGETMNAAKKVLEAAGAKKVVGLGVAH